MRVRAYVSGSRYCLVTDGTSIDSVPDARDYAWTLYMELDYAALPPSSVFGSRRILEALERRGWYLGVFDAG